MFLDIYPHHFQLGYELITLPGWASFLIIVSLNFFVVLLGLLLRKLFFKYDLIADSYLRFTSTLLSIIGGLTAFTISFVIVNAWIKYQDQVNRMELEAVELSNFYRDCYAYPKAKAKELQQGILQYTEHLITDGWPKLVNGVESMQCRKDINRIYDILLTYIPQNELEKNALKNGIDHIHQLVLYRHLRVLDSQHPIIPNILWYAIGVGIFMSLLTTFFIRLPKVKIQILLTLIYSISISTLVFVGMQLNYPYRGVIKLEPFPLEKFQEEGQKFYPDLFSNE